MSKDQVKKLKQYIQDDRPNKLRTFVRKHKLCPREIQLKHGQNLLHYCGKNGSGTVLKYLIREEVNGLHQNDKFDTPLHVALQRALAHERSCEYDTTTDCYTDLVLPLLEKFPGSLDLTNSSGVSGRSLLRKLVQCRQRKDSETSSSSDSDTERDPDGGHGIIDDIKWRDKLAAEWQDEYYSNVGRYEQDLSDFATQQETYDDWASRIHSEYHAKKKSRSQIYCTKEKSKRSKTDHTPKSQAGPENLEDIRSQMREKFKKASVEEVNLKILKRRMKYEKRYKEVLERESESKLGYVDIPWPSFESGTIDDMTVLFEGMDRGESEYKNYLRDQRIRWHPDKFLQRFGDCLKQDDRAKIMKRVTQLSQNINKLLTS